MVVKTEQPDDVPTMPTGPVFLAESGPLESRSTIVKNKRREQLRRYEEFLETLDSSGTEKHSAAKHARTSAKPTKNVRFQDGDVFLSACTSGDLNEVAQLLEQGANIDTASVDGLTALHQAVIDGKLDMVEFLVEQGANLNAQDNEGWTPLHAAACCDQHHIVRYLLNHGADIRLTNSDKELPSDLCENEELRQMFLSEYSSRGIDPDLCRHYEEERMLKDVHNWMQAGRVQDVPHPRTGASALHVAAAKGYIRVINLLLQAGADMRAQDKDGWTALHAAAHWGEREACEILAEAGADFDAASTAGHTVMHVVDEDMVDFLQALRAKQKQPSQPEHDGRSPSREGSSSRRSSTSSRTSTRDAHAHRLMSTEEKQELTKKDESDEHMQLAASTVGNDHVHVVQVEPETTSSFKRPPVKVAKVSSVDQVPVTTSVLRRPAVSPVNAVSQPTQQQQPVASVAPTQKDGVFKVPASPPIARAATPPPQQQQHTSVIHKTKKVPSPLHVAPVKLDESVKQKVDQMLPASPSLDGGSRFQHASPAASDSSARGSPLTPTRRRDKTPNPWMRTASVDTPSEDELASSQLKMPPTGTTTGVSPNVHAPAIHVVPFTPPQPRDEAEAERKAKSKRERAARRSTQGVTIEQIRAAQEMDPSDSTSSSRKSSTASTSGYEKPPADPAPYAASSAITSTALPWRSRALEKQSTPEKADAHQIWSDATVSALSQTVDTVLSPVSSTSQQQPDNLNVTPKRITAGQCFLMVGKSMTRLQQFAAKGDVIDEADGVDETDAGGSGGKQPTPPQETPSASALRRRPRLNQSARRVPHTHDEQANNSVFEPSDSTVTAHAPVTAKPAAATHKTTATVAPTTRPSADHTAALQRVTVSIQQPHTQSLSGYTNNKYPGAGVGSGGSAPSSSSAAQHIDYKALYDRELHKNDTLQQRLNELEQQLRRHTLDEPSHNGYHHKTADSIELRKCEQRIQELEAQLNTLDQLRADNKRLKDENGALIRVISKLSK